MTGFFIGPPSTRETSDITLDIKRNGNPKMTGTHIISAIANTYTATVTPVSKVINEVTTYSLEFNMIDGL